MVTKPRLRLLAFLAGVACILWFLIAVVADTGIRVRPLEPTAGGQRFAADANQSPPGRFGSPVFADAARQPQTNEGRKKANRFGDRNNGHTRKL